MHKYINMFKCMYKYMYMHKYIDIYGYIYIYTYLYIYIWGGNGHLVVKNLDTLGAVLKVVEPVDPLPVVHVPHHCGQDRAFRVQGAGFRVQGAGFRFRVLGSGSRVQGSGFRVQGGVTSPTTAIKRAIAFDAGSNFIYGLQRWWNRRIHSPSLHVPPYCHAKRST